MTAVLPNKHLSKPDQRLSGDADDDAAAAPKVVPQAHDEATGSGRTDELKSHRQRTHGAMPLPLTADEMWLFDLKAT